MNSLREQLTKYIETRRALGFKLEYPGVALFDFVSFMEQKGAAYVTTALALEWSLRPQSVLPSMHARRLSMVRTFAKHLSAIDPRTEVPADLLHHPPMRAKPYIYTEDEITRILAEALALPGSDLKRKTYYCVLGLLSVTGMRISEVLELRTSHVNLSEGVLTIEKTKFGKSRLVPLHVSTREALSDYLVIRNKLAAKARDNHFFVSDRGQKLVPCTVNSNFNLLLRRIGLRAAEAKRGPRLHDFRHRFAITTLLNWYRRGLNVEQRLPILSTFLGHTNIADTYWYLTACPELMGSVASLLEKRWEEKQ
ncbi:MAG: tyrosine-type recombinase/integrase [Nitrososphaerales archaeon]